MSATFSDFSSAFFSEFFKRILLDDATKEVVIASVPVRDALLDQYKTVGLRGRYCKLVISLATSVPHLPISEQMHINLSALPQLHQISASIEPLLPQAQELEHVVFTAYNHAVDIVSKTRYEEVADMIFDFLRENSAFKFSTPVLRLMFDELLSDEAFSTSLARIVTGIKDRFTFHVVCMALNTLCKKDADPEQFLRSIPEFSAF